jgi:WD40 repeat protein
MTDVIQTRRLLQLLIGIGLSVIALQLVLHKVPTTSLNTPTDTSTIRGEERRYLKLYDRSGKLLAPLQGGHFVFSADGQLIATTPSINSDDSLWLYDQSGQQLAQLKGGFPEFSPDSQRLMLQRNNENRLQSWLYERSGKLIGELKGNSPRFTADGQQIITTDYGEGKTWLYDPSGKLIALLEGTSPVLVAPDRPWLMTHSPVRASYKSYLYDLSGKRLAQVEGNIQNISPTGQRMIANFHGDSVAQLYDLAGQPIAQLQGLATLGRRISNVGKRIVTEVPTEKPRLYDFAGQLIAELEGGYAEFTGNGQLLFTRSGTGMILHDFTGQKIAELQGDQPRLNFNGQQIATTVGTEMAANCKTLLYTRSGQQLASLDGKFGGFSQDGTQLFIDEVGTGAQIYDLSGQLIAELQGTFRSFHPNRQRVIVTYEPKNNTTRLYDLSGQHLANLEGAFGGFSPDGQQFAVFQRNAAGQSSTQLHDLSGQRLANVEGAFGGFSPDGQRLITNSTPPEPEAFIPPSSEAEGGSCTTYENFLYAPLPGFMTDPGS